MKEFEVEDFFDPSEFLPIMLFLPSSTFQPKVNPISKIRRLSSEGLCISPIDG